MKRLPINKMYTWLRYICPWRIRVGGRENKDNLGWMKQTPLQRTDNWSRECWNDRIHLKKSTSVGKELKRQPWRWRRISIHIEIWEHRLGKVWNQHLTSKQLEYHNWKQKQRIGLQNKPEQTYDKDFVRSFRGGAYTGSIVQHHHVQGSAHDIRSVPESA